MVKAICPIGRRKMCYVILVLSIIFFLSSVCTYAVLAVAKSNNQSGIFDNKDIQREVEHRRIIERLEKIEEKVKKRNKRNNK